MSTVILLKPYAGKPRGEKISVSYSLGRDLLSQGIACYPQDKIEAVPAAAPVLAPIAIPAPLPEPVTAQKPTFADEPKEPAIFADDGKGKKKK